MRFFLGLGCGLDSAAEGREAGGIAETDRRRLAQVELKDLATGSAQAYTKQLESFARPQPPGAHAGSQSDLVIPRCGLHRHLG